MRHETLRRQRYDAAWREAQRQGAFNMFFLDASDELTEGGRSNVFLRLDGERFTPPLPSGLMSSVMRSVLLEDPILAARERVVTCEDLLRADEIMSAMPCAAR